MPQTAKNKTTRSRTIAVPLDLHEHAQQVSAQMFIKTGKKMDLQETYIYMMREFKENNLIQSI